MRPVRGAASAGRPPRSEAPARWPSPPKGRWPGGPSGKPFRLVVIGDGDFASNSFFPYMSNSDLALAALAWLVGEERAPTMKPPVEVLPTVVLTNRQVRGIFLFTRHRAAGPGRGDRRGGVVGAPALTRAVWMSAAIGAGGGCIVALALHGRRPDPSLARFEAGGRHAPDRRRTRVTEVVVSRGERRWRFKRADAEALGHGSRESPAAARDVAARIDSGLRFLHVSAPQRVLAAGGGRGHLRRPSSASSRRATRVGQLLRGRSPFTVEFGALNAQGLAQYARVAGRDEILLLPSFVGEPWEVA